MLEEKLFTVVFVSAGRIGSLTGLCRGRDQNSAIYLVNVANYILYEIYQMYSGVGQGPKY